MEKKFYLPELGYEVTLGKFANQADGAVWLQQGGTVVLTTAVSSPSKEFPGFLPLSVDYRENFAAAGKIPGGYFKREGRPSDREVLTSRLIDRSLRPLFPEKFFDQIQVLSTVYSVDKEHAPYTLALVASSLSLVISDIPFIEPIGATEVVRIEDEWIVNPTYTQSLSSDVKITVAGTEEGICMVEGRSNEISEGELIDILFKAHDVIKKQVAWQKTIQKEVGVEKQEITEDFNWDEWHAIASSYLTADRLKTLYTADKAERSKAMKELKNSFTESVQNKVDEEDISSSYVGYTFEQVLKVKLTDSILENKHRLDGRSFDKVRQISTEVSLLPCNHGSALFTRGETQALVSVTLGGSEDEQKVEDLMRDTTGRAFMLHYNFPPYSVGEVKPLRGPGRREVGHGYLAASALKPILPNQQEFPYTIRIVADMLS
jgi:polyribonucleotide nucleotidyltransferase